MSEGEQHFRGGALVHRSVALRRLVQREGEVEDLAGVDRAVPDELDQPGQVLPDGGRAAVDVDTGHEQLVTGDRDVVEDADETHVTARPGGVDRLHHGLLGTDGLDHRVRAEPPGELLDPGNAVVAAFLDDVGGTELAGQRLAVRVAAERDDALGAELPRGEDAEESDGAVTDDRDRLAGAGLSGLGGEPTGAEHVGGRHQGGDEIGFGHARGGDEGAVGERGAGQFRLGADGPHQHPVHAVGLVPGLADLAAVVGGPEGPDDEVADLDGADLGADLLDDADVLVTHDLVLDRLCAPVGPQVAAADAGRREADDRVCRRDDLGVLAVLDPGVTGSVHNDLTHWMRSCSWCSFAGAVVPAASSEPGADSDRKALPMGALTGNPSPLGPRLDAASTAWTTVMTFAGRCVSSSPPAAPASPRTGPDFRSPEPTGAGTAAQ